jgi:hypothetical protein
VIPESVLMPVVIGEVNRVSSVGNEELVAMAEAALVALSAGTVSHPFPLQGSQAQHPIKSHSQKKSESLQV